MPKNETIPKIYQTRRKNKHACLKSGPYMPKEWAYLPTYQPTCLKSGHTSQNKMPKEWAYMPKEWAYMLKEWTYIPKECAHMPSIHALNGLRPWAKPTVFGHGQGLLPAAMGRARGRARAQDPGLSC